LKHLVRGKQGDDSTIGKHEPATYQINGKNM
jgi:hypothetical protein